MAFEIFGYYVEYFIDGKLIGTLNIKEPDRAEVGYIGKQNHIADEDIILNKGKKIKKGLNYYTFMYPLCGKVVS